MKKIYTSIDIGSDTIKIVTGEYYKSNLNVLAALSIKSKGIRKGLIIDPNLAITSLKDGIKEISQKLGIEIKKVIVNIPSYNANFMYVTGKLDIKSQDNIITTEDINKVIKNSVYSKLAKDYELITVLPISFVLDNEETNYPVGKVSSKIEIKGIMVSVPKKNVYSVLSVVEATGLEVVDITLSSIGEYYEVKTPSTDKKVGAVINLGHETTDVSVYNKGILMNTETIQLGGINIENDLSYVFHVNIFDSRVLKEKFAVSDKRFAKVGENYFIKNTLNEEISLSQIEVSEVVMSRLSEILTLAKKQILLLTKKDINYIILTGGLTEIKYFRNLVVDIFGKDVIIYTTRLVGTRDNKYTVSLGMLKYFANKMEERGKEYSMVTKDEEDLLINPRTNKSNKIKITKLFESFKGNKEDK